MKKDDIKVETGPLMTNMFLEDYLVLSHLPPENLHIFMKAAYMPAGFFRMDHANSMTAEWLINNFETLEHWGHSHKDTWKMWQECKDEDERRIMYYKLLVTSDDGFTKVSMLTDPLKKLLCTFHLRPKIATMMVQMPAEMADAEKPVEPKVSDSEANGCDTEFIKEHTDNIRTRLYGPINEAVVHALSEQSLSCESVMEIAAHLKANIDDNITHAIRFGLTHERSR